MAQSNYNPSFSHTQDSFQNIQSPYLDPTTGIAIDPRNGDALQGPPSVKADGPLGASSPSHINGKKKRKLTKEQIEAWKRGRDKTLKFNPETGEVTPSLVNTGQSGTWSRKQKRVFKTLSSWMTYLRGQGYQLFRVDLTSSPQSENSLTVDFKKLRRMIESKFYSKFHYFKIETSEGVGVLHMVWAIKSPVAYYIPQKFLSDAWKKIHGAKIVFIRRISTGNSNIKRIGRYCVQQYLTGGQDAIVRVSWSWWRTGFKIGSNFKMFFRECRRGFFSSLARGENPFTKVMTFKDAMGGWSSLLEFGSWHYGGAWFLINNNGEVDVGYE